MNNYISYKNGDPVETEFLYKPITLLCNSMASFDMSNGISYRCNTCGAVVGSGGMLDRCKELYAMERVVESLKGKNERN